MSFRSGWILGLILLVAFFSFLVPLQQSLPITDRFHLRVVERESLPEFDVKSDLPRGCVAKHAALEVAGLDPNLVRIKLPPWQPQPESNRTGIAYIAPVGLPYRLGIVARVFGQLYRREDFFFYHVDRKYPGLRQALLERLAERFESRTLPPNVVVATMPHAGRAYYWGHTANVFAALHETLRLSGDWQWLIHLHDGAYPAHSPEYMREYLSARRGVNFMQLEPWDLNRWQASRSELVHSCESWVGPVANQHFPQAEVTAHGFHWAHGSEWWSITRELATYFADERLRPFLDLMQYRVDVEEIIWASAVQNIPGFAQLVASKVTWESYSCQVPQCRNSRQSPTNLEDTLQDLFYKEFREHLQDIFLIRPVTPSRSEGLLDWLDARIAWEVRYLTSHKHSGFPASPPAFPPANSLDEPRFLRTRRGF